MRDATDGPAHRNDPLTERLRATAGLVPLVAAAEAVWRARAGSAGGRGPDRPAWRPFEDAFPTFYQFTNRPPR